MRRYNSHVILEPSDCRCGDGRCPTCDWGLAFCVVCCGGEVELDKDCLSRRCKPPMTERFILQPSRQMKIWTVYGPADLNDGAGFSRETICECRQYKHADQIRKLLNQSKMRNDPFSIASR